jgi:beta-lactamase class A
MAFTADDELEDVIRDSIGGEDERFSVVIKSLDDGSGVTIDPGRIFYPASLFKIWVMLEVFHQRDAGLLEFGERYVVSPYYEGLRLSAGELAPCSEVSVGDALYAMMASSDNVAANLLYDRVGYSNVDETLRQIGVGYSGILSEGDLQTTAAGMATVLEAIGAGEAISPASSEEMIAALESNVIDDRIPALLPAGTRIAHKTGNWSNVTHDVGIVFSPEATYVIAILTDYSPEDDGADRIARLSKAVYDYYNS